MTMSTAIRSAAVRSSAARRSSSSQATWAANSRRIQDLNLRTLQRAAQERSRQIQRQMFQANQRRLGQMRQRNIQILAQQRLQAQMRQNQTRQNQILQNQMRINQSNARNRLQQQNRQMFVAINNRNFQNQMQFAQRILNRNRQNSISKCQKNPANHQLRREREIKAWNQKNYLNLKTFNAQAELIKKQANSRAQQISNLRGRQLLNQIRIERETVRQLRERSLPAPKKTVASHATSQRHPISSSRPAEKPNFFEAVNAARAIKASRSTFSQAPTPIAPPATQRRESKDNFGGSRGGSPPRIGGGAAPQANNLNLGIRLRAEYTLQEASVVDSKGHLTSKAIKTAEKIISAVDIGNHDVLKAIIKSDPLLKKWLKETQKNEPLSERVLNNIKADREFQKWAKYRTTQKVIFDNQQINIHFYKNGQTHQIISSIDYKVKASRLPEFSNQLRGNIATENGSLYPRRIVKSKTDDVHGCMIS